MLFDTIVGIATLRGRSAVNVIRVSGDEAIEKVAAVFRGRDLTAASSHTVSYGHLVDGNEIVDEVLVSVFRKPRSYTAEDVVEINTHGGFLVPDKVISVLVASGCRVAEPGEFTRRAYLNGRIDLTQAEAIMDVIEAKTESQLKLAHHALGGAISELVSSLQKEILELLSAIEVNIDFPEYDDAIVMTDAILSPRIVELRERIDVILRDATTGRLIREGVKAVIVGKPNVGKSSLLNVLLKEERAIVTPISGTTRDLVEGELSLGGILLRLIDTAGIRDTSDLVESIGIERSRKAMEDADLVLLVLDQSASLTEDDRRLLRITQGKPRIIVGNKVDLGRFEQDGIDDMIDVSAKNGTGIESLEKAVRTLLIDGRVSSSDGAVVTNARHIGKLKEARSALVDAWNGCASRVPVDMVGIDLKRAWESLGDITGTTGTEALTSTLFSRFCLGK